MSNEAEASVALCLALSHTRRIGFPQFNFSKYHTRKAAAPQTLAVKLCASCKLARSSSGVLALKAQVGEVR